MTATESDPGTDAATAARDGAPTLAAGGRPTESAMGLKVRPGGGLQGLVSPRLAAPSDAARDDRDEQLLESAGQRLEQIADRLQDIYVTLENLRVTLAGLTAATDDHEQRLRRLESWKQRVHAAGTVLAFTLGAALTALLEGLFGN